MRSNVPSLGLLIFASAVMMSLSISCRHLPLQNPAERTKEQDQVILFIHSIEATVTAKGPLAWLTFFDNSPAFLMANDGVLVFHNYEEARSAITTVLINSIRKISLQYDNIRIDALQQDIAGVAADFHEILTNAAGKNNSYNGFFTAIAVQTSQGWKFRNVQWSTVRTQ